MPVRSRDWVSDGGCTAGRGRRALADSATEAQGEVPDPGNVSAETSRLPDGIAGGRSGLDPGTLMGVARSRT